MDREQMNWENELAMLEENSKNVKSMMYNKGVALRDSKGFNGTALAIGIVEYFMQKNSALSGSSHIPKYNTLNGIVNRLVNLYGDDVLYDAYTNSPTKLEELMGQHRIDYKEFAGLIDLHFKNLTKDPNLAEAFLNQDINKYLNDLEQVLGKTPEQVVQNENTTTENIVQISIEKVSDEKKGDFSQRTDDAVEQWNKQRIENLVVGVLIGMYGVREERRAALGKDYAEVQRIVNERLKQETNKVQEQLKQELPKVELKQEVQQVKMDEPKKEEKNTVEPLTFEQKIEQMAQDVLVGKYGSGIQRKQALGELYNPVQARANQLALENARKSQFGSLETQTVEQPIVENREEFEIVVPRHEKKRNIFLIGWQKFANGFKKFFWRHNGDEMLALNPGTGEEEGVKKS